MKTRKMMNKSIVLLSGGLDSLVSLGLAKEEYNIELALTFDYGQKSLEKEVAASNEDPNYNASLADGNLPFNVCRIWLTDSVLLWCCCSWTLHWSDSQSITEADCEGRASFFAKSSAERLPNHLEVVQGGDDNQTKEETFFKKAARVDQQVNDNSSVEVCV